MTTQNLINVVRIGGRHLTPTQVRDVVAQLERIPAMERTLAAKDSDFAQLSVAYSAARAECERLKEAVRWLIECAEMEVRKERWFWPEPKEAEIRANYDAARKAVEELL